MKKLTHTTRYSADLIGSIAGIRRPDTEVKFDAERKFRFDFAWPEAKLALEVNGGTWNGGAHGRAKGIHRDYEKLNLAQWNGWAVLQVTPQDVYSSNLGRMLKELYDLRLTLPCESCRKVPLERKTKTH